MRLPSWFFKGVTIPVFLGLCALALVLYSVAGGGGRGNVVTLRIESDAPVDEMPLWRCHACAKAPDKAWIPCKNVTGRGNEKGARDRVKERVCQEAGAPLDECVLTQIDCRQIDEGATVSPSKQQ